MLFLGSILVASLFSTCAFGRSGDNCSPATKTFKQKVDHIGDSGEVFQQQYQVIDEYFHPGGPIIFYQGGEATDMICLVSHSQSWKSKRKREKELLQTSRCFGERLE